MRSACALVLLAAVSLAVVVAPAVAKSKPGGNVRDYRVEVIPEWARETPDSVRAQSRRFKRAQLPSRFTDTCQDG